MHKLADLILCSGVFVFFIGGIGIAFGILAKDSPALPVIAVLALLLIGAGGTLKKRGGK